MSWYYNQITGQVFAQGGLAAAALNADIAVQRHDPLKGQTVWGPYATQAAADTAKAAHPPVANMVLDAATPAVKTIVGAVESWVVRLGEIALGIALLAIAAHAMLFRQDSSPSITRTVAAVAKVVK